MKLALLLCLLLSMTMTLSSDTRLMLDTENRAYQLPRRYRALPHLQISASAQFSQKELEELLKQLALANPVTVVDLRQECHGFIDGTAVTWYAKHNAANIGKSLFVICKTENALLAELQREGDALLHTTKPGSRGVDTTHELKVIHAMSEEALCHELKAGYLRLPVTDHMAPEIASVDRFVRFASHLPEKMWLHIHCRGGRGRSSTFVVMFDMMKNAKKLSLDDILDREWRAGNDNLAYVPELLSWRSFRKIERYEFLRRFYAYCQASDASFTKSYSEWLSN